MITFEIFVGNILSVFNAEEMISEGGLLIMFLAVYAQTGLFFSFFVPSGIFLFTGGIFIATGKLDHDIFTTSVFMVTACMAGCMTGYWFGRKTGPLLYERKDSRFFKQQHLKAADNFYKKYGQYALTAGMLFPIIRTFSPIIAGIVKMNFGQFLFLVFLGSVLWVVPFIVAGYIAGNIPVIKEYLPYIVLAFLILVTTPIVIRIIKELKKKQ